MRARPARRAARALLCLALLVVNAWPALHNRQPFFYADTTAYIRGAEAGFERLTGFSTEWTQNASITRTSISSIPDKAVLSGRSIYYGALLYISAIVGKLWPAVFIQSAVVLIAIALTLRVLALFTWRRLTVVCLLLAALTPLPFFVSFLVPDIFAAITILAVANLLITGRQPVCVVCLWTALLISALLFHDSDPLIALVLLALFGLAALVFGIPSSRVGVTAIIACLLVGLAGLLAFNAAVRALISEPPLRPPILTGRLISDGPGYRYLSTSCPASGFTVCRFLNRLPVETDHFVWDTNPNSGVFAVASPAIRRALSKEQYRFAWAVFRFDPFGVIADYLHDTVLQTTRIGYQEFSYDSGAREFFGTHLPAAYYKRVQRTAAWNGRMPKSLLTTIAILATCLSLFCIAWLLLRRRTELLHNTVTAFVLFVCVGVLVNGAVCALSALHDRYQTRVIWLVPFAALLLYFKSNRSAAPPSTI